MELLEQCLRTKLPGVPSRNVVYRDQAVDAAVQGLVRPPALGDVVGHFLTLGVGRPAGPTGGPGLEAVAMHGLAAGEPQHDQRTSEDQAGERQEPEVALAHPGGLAACHEPRMCRFHLPRSFVRPVRICLGQFPGKSVGFYPKER